MNRSTPGLPVHHQLPEFTQTYVHQVSDAIQTSHPLSSPSPPAFNPSQHQSIFQWLSSSHEMAKVLEFQLQHHSFQRNSRADFLQNGLVGSPRSPRGSQESSPTPQFKSINSSAYRELIPGSHWGLECEFLRFWRVISDSVPASNSLDPPGRDPGTQVQIVRNDWVCTQTHKRTQPYATAPAQRAGDNSARTHTPTPSYANAWCKESDMTEHTHTHSHPPLLQHKKSDTTEHVHTHTHPSATATAQSQTWLSTHTQSHPLLLWHKMSDTTEWLNWTELNA